ATILFVLRVDWSGSGRRPRSTRRLRAGPASGGGRGRSVDPARPTVRRGADGAPGGRGDAQALVNAATQLGAALVEVRKDQEMLISTLHSCPTTLSVTCQVIAAFAIDP